MTTATQVCHVAGCGYLVSVERGCPKHGFPVVLSCAYCAEPISSDEPTRMMGAMVLHDRCYKEVADDYDKWSDCIDTCIDCGNPVPYGQEYCAECKASC